MTKFSSYVLTWSRVTLGAIAGRPRLPPLASIRIVARQDLVAFVGRAPISSVDVECFQGCAVYVSRGVRQSRLTYRQDVRPRDGTPGAPVPIRTVRAHTPKARPAFCLRYRTEKVEAYIADECGVLPPCAIDLLGVTKISRVAAKVWDRSDSRESCMPVAMRLVYAGRNSTGIRSRPSLHKSFADNFSDVQHRKHRMKSTQTLFLCHLVRAIRSFRAEQVVPVER